MIFENYTDYNIYQIGEDGSSRFKASINDQTRAIMAGNALALSSGRTHAVEIRQGQAVIGLLYFAPSHGQPAAIGGVRDDRMGEAAAGFLHEREAMAEIARSEPVDSWISKFTLQRAEATRTIYTTRDFQAACEAVKAWGWAGCKVRRNGPVHPQKGQSWLIIVGDAPVGAEREVA